MTRSLAWTLVCLTVWVMGPRAAAALCSVDADPVSFGNVNLVRETRGTGRIVVDCSEAISFRVGIASAGSGRRMRGTGGGTLDYELYPNVARSIVWGDGQGSGSLIGSASDGEDSTRMTVYGVIPAQPSAQPGEYVDSLTITLVF